MPKSNKTKRINSITLCHSAQAPHGHLIARDHELALNDLQRESLFHPVNDKNGPYEVNLSIEENRLIFRIQNSVKQEMPILVLSLKPYRRLIKDYFLIVESYEAALKNAGPSKIEAIDQGRRGLHNEGATLLMERLESKITMDHDTARRLFSLICVLHAESARLWA